MTAGASPAHRDKRFCGAAKRQGEGHCRRPAGWGTDHPGTGQCKLHGGCMPNNRRSAQNQAAELAVVTYGLPRDISPAEALLEEVRYTAGHVAWLREQIQAMEAGDLVWGVTRVKTGGEDHGTTEEAVPSVWLELYYRERRHLVDVTKAAISAGIEERRVRLAEAQGSLVASVIRAILADLGLTAEQQARVPEVVPLRLRALAG